MDDPLCHALIGLRLEDAALRVPGALHVRQTGRQGPGTATRVVRAIRLDDGSLELVTAGFLAGPEAVPMQGQGPEVGP
ncbi:MAG TPA: hypothetical protein VNM16_11960 [Bacillota bacterium]|nr:hypothetical protein [Bacillota bacterium]